MNDYETFLKETGITEESIQQNMSKLTHYNFNGFEWIYPIFSEIQGIGLASKFGYSAGEFICPAVISGYRTPAARYINHSSDPNVEARFGELNVSIHALKEIKPGEEFTCDYALNYSKSGK